MKTIFDEATRSELLRRINSLQENNEAQWGKINVYQMARHCTLWDEWTAAPRRAKTCARNTFTTVMRPATLY